MKTKALAIIVAGVGVLFALTTANASPVYEGWRYDHTAITHSGDVTLDAYVAKALVSWGVYSSITDGGSGKDIVVHVGAPNGASQYAAAITLPKGRPETGLIEPNVPGGSACDIYIAPGLTDTYRDNRAQLERIVMHEVGHCLGLDHEPDLLPECIMGGAQGMCEDDAVGIATLYPPAPRPHRLTVGMLAR